MTMGIASDSRFTPGGAHPPFLAGRNNEKDEIKFALDHLGAGLKTAENIALIGPCGNGKTALLRWAEAQIANYNDKIKCVDLNPKSFESHHDLVRTLAKPGILSTLANDGFSASVSLFGSEIAFSRQESAKDLLRPVLDRSCAKTGLAILIDEAHTLDRYKDVVRAFFFEVQTLVSKDRPLLMILAGTPNIVRRLSVIDATYWERLNAIGIGLLDDEAARDAIRVPLEHMRYRIDADVLDQAVNAAQRYPYFLQFAGAALHRVALLEPDKLGCGNSIGTAIWKRASEDLRDRRSRYYAERYRELRRAGLLPTAQAVARRFVSQGTESIPNADFEAAVAGSMSLEMENLARSKGAVEPTAWFEDELRDVGFVWSQVGREHFCEPGIPSLMNYILEEVF